MENIILAVILTAGIALLAGLLLSLAARFMSVNTNKKAEDIQEFLPGANCGACGFSGCAGYAKAVAENLAEPNLCVPGGEAVVQKISQYLGVDSITTQPKVAIVRCNGNFDNVQEDKIYQGLGGCTAVSLLYGGNYACQYACLGLGDCAKVCGYNAINICNGRAQINPDVCKACGKCVAECPKKLISIVDRKPQAMINCSNCTKGSQAIKVCKVSCIGCGKCAKVCEQDAIRINNFLANIDFKKCSACGECVKVCPRSCISLVDF